ncbi:MAG: sigma-70 family RNA polymerase sigma factor [Pirellulaceae bacterium]
MSDFVSTRTLSTAACAMLMAASVGQAAPTTHLETQAIQRVERYCQTSWRNAGIAPQDWEDCTQQTYVELLHRVARARWYEAIENAESRERRELNRSIWCVAQRWRRRQRFAPPQGDVVQQAEEQRGDLHAAARDVRELIDSPKAPLSKRQREILQLALDGASVAEIADQLGDRPQRISNQKYKALEKLRAMFA